jgi:butyryl-CoA dehydrogenase
VKNLKGRVAAITGAGSGIGRGLAIEAVGRGMNVALCDLNAEGLAETVSLCEGQGVKVSSRLLDVSDRTAVYAWSDEVMDEHGRVDLVINNAGVALGANVVDMSIEDFEWLMGINFWGVVHGTQAFLRHMVAAGSGHVVNISSVFGLIPVPTQSAYNSAKYAVRGFTDALRIELNAMPGDLSATTVHPGGVKTNIARSARMSEQARQVGPAANLDIGAEFERVARTTPAEAAVVILNGVERNARRVVVGADGKVIDGLSRLPLSFIQRLLTAGTRRMNRA